MNDARGTNSQTMYVKPTDAVLIATLVGIISRPKGNPFVRRYRQFASVSTPATTIAAGPPYSRKVRKTRASEKLIANFERGNATLIRGASKEEKTSIDR